jgi:predicted Ser/Thr protein kinase
VVDSPVDVPSSSGFKPRPNTGTEITQTFNGEGETPWGGLTTSDLQTPSIGSVLDFGELGAFKLEARLGRGGMGEVYRARQVGPKGFSQVVAIKRLRPGRHEWEERSFVDEARVLSMLHHENIARVYGFYELEGNAYLVMEYIEGETLYSLLEIARHRGTRFSERAACLIAADVAEALHYTHQATDDAGRLLHIAHRDVSTTNIIISNTGRTKLVDFGVAYSKLEGRTQTSASSTIIKGKAPYLSPEQVKHLPLDARSDLFSLGTILVEMLTGEAPFGWAADVATLKRIARVTPEYVATATAGVSKELRAICQKLLMKEPSDRYQNGHEVAQALRRHAGQYEGRALVEQEVGRLKGLPGTAAPTALRELKDMRRALTVAGAIALTLIALLSWYSHRPALTDRTTMPQHESTAARSAQPLTANTCFRALALAHVAAIAACHAHLPKGARGELCSANPDREVLAPRGMTDLPAQFFVEFVSLKGDQVCRGKPIHYGPKLDGPKGEMVPYDEGQREPCPYGDGPIVAKMSWQDPRTDVFGPGLGPHRYDRPLLLGYSHVVPVQTGLMMGEVLDEPAQAEHPRVGVARMMVVFNYIQMLNGNKQPICGVLFWQDGKEGIPVLGEEYYGERVAADWGEKSYVQLFWP